MATLIGRARKLLKENRGPLLIAGCIVVGSLVGALMAIGSDLPQVEQLEELKPNIVTQVFAADGSILGEFAIEKRVIVRYEEIPEVLRNAIIATEDENFFNHIGINLWRIPGALYANFRSGRKGQGFSTLTMQLSRLLFLSPQKTYERKLREILLALEIERRFTKKEIFTLYCNLVNFGHGNYGVEAASRFYFGKSAKDLNLEEAALIAGLPQSPTRLSPLDHPEAAQRRRNHALDRMVAEKYITPAQARTAQNQPLNIVARRSPSSIAPYFLEEVRKTLERDYGFTGIYRSGLKVYTTLDPKLQLVANRAVRDGILRNDRTARGFRPVRESALKDGVIPEGFTLSDWRQPFDVGDVVRGVVAWVEKDGAGLQIGDTVGRLPLKAIAWTGKARVTDVLKIGDIVPVRIVKLEGTDAKHVAEVTYEQEPDAESAFLAMDTRTGAVKAMVGGFDFERSKFNRAVQAHRQTGSIFKAIVYSAAVESLGWGPETLIVDSPITFTAAGSPTWSPHNYDMKFEGTITVQHAVEESRNIPAIKTLQAIGVEKGIEYARKLGLKDDLPPYLPIAIGAGEATLDEMVAAFGTIANEGLRMTPMLITKITDNEGNVLEEKLPEAHDALRPETAATMANILRGVVLRGTAQRASSLGRPLCGKTGTTDNWSDTWFVGFERDMVAGVWSGFDDKRKSLGRGQDGARTSLPIFMDFWREASKQLPKDQAFPPPMPAQQAEMAETRQIP
ncbi:MAG: PBP1A family penicillin-binding protein [Vicinamibacteria bacterium]|nr:PBP1A family penicillin-binding protein [Vicinamibacteria bacterium]